MATAADKQATFSVAVDDGVSGPAEDAAKAIEALRDRMKEGESSIKDMSAALRRLRGSSDEVKAAKESLKAKIQAERDALSKSQLEMLKSADAAKKLTERDKALAKQKEAAKDKAKGLSNAINAAGGPVASLKAKLGSLQEVLGGAGGGMNAAAFAAAGLVTACVAAAAAVGALVVGFAHFVISNANALRSANLFREAAAGSSANAVALGTQVEALARKVPTARSALNELATSLAKGGIQGQTLVDTLNAVGQASAAMGDDAGGKLRELVDRGRLSQRFVVNPMELQGTGLQFDDIANALAEKMHIGVDKARKALFEGAVKLGDGAAAMRAAVEKKFGGLNLRKMLDLNVIIEKLKEKFETLTENVNLEPLLKAFSTLADLFDDTTVTGDAIKQLVTILGGSLIKGMTDGVPLVKKFFQGMLIGALTAGIAFLQLRNRIRATFGDVEVLKGIDGLQVALTAGKVIILGMIAGLAALVGWLTLAGAAVYLIVKPFIELGKLAKSAYDSLTGIDWGAAGASIVDGLVTGIKSRVKSATDAIKGVGEAIKKGFKDTLEIHSPSRVFKGYAHSAVDGWEEGADERAPAAASAMDDLAAPPKGDGPRARSGGGVTITIPITIQVSGGADAAKQLTESSFLSKLVKQLEEELISAGIPALVGA